MALPKEAGALLAGSRDVIGRLASQAASDYQANTPHDGKFGYDKQGPRSEPRIQEFVRPFTATPFGKSIAGYEGVRAMRTSSEMMRLPDGQGTTSDVQVVVKLEKGPTPFDVTLKMRDTGDAVFSLHNVVNGIDQVPSGDVPEETKWKVVGNTVEGLLVAEADANVLVSDGIDIDTDPLREYIDHIDRNIRPIQEFTLRPGMDALIPQRLRR